MIDYKKNRIDYGETLSPPPGYKLDQAIATTYSLDLFALLSIPVALFYKKNLDGHVSETRMDILDAIQKTSDSVKVYCQKGNISVPRSFNKIVSFIDDCVSEILPADGRTSFHPKIWVIRYVKEKSPVIYRFFIMSRNLTFDRSWDLAYFMEGYVGRAVEKKNQPLIDFIRYLKSQSDFTNSSRFINDLKKVKFDFDFDNAFFHPMGFKKHRNPLPINCKNLLIISPFIDDNALFRFKKNCIGKRYLFSRKEELDKLSKKALDDYETYCISDKIIDGEDYFDEGSEFEALPQNLHAKLFVCDGTVKVRWFLGSANCTTAALKKNTEFLIELITSNGNYSVNSIKNILLGDEEKKQYFEPYERKDDHVYEKDPTEDLIRSTMYHLMQFLDEGKLTGDCYLADETHEKYNVNISITSIPNVDLSIFKLRFSLYGREDYRELKESGEEVFEGINIENLSPFLDWKLEHIASKTCKEFITKMDIQLPPNRKDAVLRSIIQSKEKFFQFLQFLLGYDSGNTEFTKGIQRAGNSNVGDAFIWGQDSAILEELLINISRNNDRVLEIDRIIEKLSSNPEKSPVPKDFLEFWEVIKPFING